jgi:hypothetical protein
MYSPPQEGIFQFGCIKKNEDLNIPPLCGDLTFSYKGWEIDDMYFPSVLGFFRPNGIDIIEY